MWGSTLSRAKWGSTPSGGPHFIPYLMSGYLLVGVHIQTPGGDEWGSTCVFATHSGSPTEGGLGADATRQGRRGLHWPFDCWGSKFAANC